MKKSIILIAAAALLSMTACQKENITPVNGSTATIDNPDTFSPRVKSAADLQNTAWIANINLGGLFTLQVDLTFDADSAHFTFPQDVAVYGFPYAVNGVNGMYTMEEMDGLNLAYDYTATTQTGNLVANDIDTTGTITPYNVPFSYSNQNDDITILLIDDDNDTLPLVFDRN